MVIYIFFSILCPKWKKKLEHDKPRWLLMKCMKKVNIGKRNGLQDSFFFSSKNIFRFYFDYFSLSSLFWLFLWAFPNSYVIFLLIIRPISLIECTSWTFSVRTWLRAFLCNKNVMTQETQKQFGKFDFTNQFLGHRIG